jgi:hypothetical protein
VGADEVHLERLVCRRREISRLSQKLDLQWHEIAEDA